MPSHLKRLYSKVGSRLSELSIGIKLTIALLCCAVFTPLALVAYTSFMEEKTLLERQRQEIQHRLDTESFFIKSLFDTASRDVVFLSQVPAVRIFSSTDFSLGRKTLETRMLDQFSKINSTEVFVDFLKTNPLYRRLTYLDIDGIERLRIDQSEGEILLLDEKLLENRFEWDYFNQTVLMSEGEVYISDIAFDSPDAAENGEFDPVIRLATQVYDKPGNLQGVLVIDMSGGILQNTARGKMPGNGAIFLIDSEGYYLAHHDAAKRWSRQRGNRHTVQADFPALKDLPHRLSGEDVRYIHVPGSEIFISPIVSDFGQTQKWYIVDVIPSSMFADSSRFYFLIVLSISFLGIVLSLLIGYAFSKIWILNPIKELTAMTGKIAQGIFTTVSLKNHQEDEIGKLCDSFNRMSDALAKAERDRKTHFDKLNWEIAERKKAEADLKLHKTFFEQSTDAMFIADSEARFTYINPAFSKITGYSTHETIGRQTEILHSEKHDQDFYRKVWKTVQKKGYWQGEVWECRKGKQHFPALQTINTIINENGDTHYVSIFKDISSLKEAENELWKLAHFDQLTNLANRKLLEERINQAISEAYRHKRVGSMIFLDLDNFKHINDSLGHNYGDLMLKEIAARLKSVFRSEDTVARLGGDEYIVLLPDLAESADEAAQITTGILDDLFKSFQLPCTIKGYDLHITTSIGIVLFPSDGDSPQKLLKQADTAMYIAKNNGKNTFSFYHSGMQEKADKRLQMERELRHGLKNNQLVVYYQPQCNKFHEIIGYEALIRWKHPERGMIAPNEFIPVAEESDLILEIGELVMLDACKQLVKAEQNGNPIPQISVNISPRQFAHLSFIDWMSSILEKTGVDANRLMLEVTEGIIVKNLEKTISNMQILKKSGIRFSIDDFGTGYSSLAYLKQLPIDELKIDRSFVCDIEINQNDAAIVDTIVAMAHHLNLDLIAEGVETRKQFDYLTECGCNGFQGYYFGRPKPGNKLHANEPEQKTALLES